MLKPEPLRSTLPEALKEAIAIVKASGDEVAFDENELALMSAAANGYITYDEVARRLIEKYRERKVP
ncbi:MAG: hypothetical protein H6999_07805 [Hahellaceae bacterium]|nr:hypothetical protein [Hahellaceae bacterium]MCP5169646.1 hypothetical protein [Hahellaceae bacterium]